MRTKVMMLAAVVALWGAGSVWAEEAAKEVTLKGTLQCGKCAMHETAKCQNVLKVTTDGKDVMYYLTDSKTTTGAHGKVCKKPIDDVSVTGTVSEKDGKNVIEATKVETPATEEKKG